MNRAGNEERKVFILVLSFGTHFFLNVKSSDAKASKCHLKFSSKMIIFYQACIFKFSNFT